MTSTLMMERTATGYPGMSVPGLGTTGYTTPTGVSPTSTWMMVPRCTFKVEKVQGGCKITCLCEDQMACSMVQNLCTMLTGGMYSCCVTLNGMTVCTYNFTMGLCRCENTDSGVCFHCTSGDQHCCDMIQSCCESLTKMLEAGCTCCFLVNNTPVCCGCSETCKTGSTPTTGKSKTSR